MHKVLTHTLLLAAESGILIAVLLYGLRDCFPPCSLAYGLKSQNLQFELGDGQDTLLKRVDSCRIYYATCTDPVLSPRQVIFITNQCFTAKVRHSFSLQPGVTQFRIDFYPKDKKYPFVTPPVIKRVRFGSKEVMLKDLMTFYSEMYKFAGYFYEKKQLMNGWWVIVIPMAVFIWLAVVVGAWEYLRRQEGNK